MTQNNYTDELYHYGRKGMRWGQHIFGKEPTGSSGSKRKKSSNSVVKSIKTALDNRKKKKEEAAKAEQAKKNLKQTPKAAKNMSTEELSEAIKHLEMEQRYNNLVAQTSTVSRGKQFASSLFDRAIVPGVTQAGSKLLEQGLMKLGKKYLGLDDDAMKSLQDKASEAKAKYEIADYENKLKNIGKDKEKTIKEQADEARDKWTAEKFKRKLENEDFSSGFVEKKQQSQSTDNDSPKKDTSADDSQRVSDYNDDLYRRYTAKNHPDNRYEVPKSYPDIDNSSYKGYDGTTLDSGRKAVSGLLGSKSSIGVASGTDMETGETFVMEILDRR